MSSPFNVAVVQSSPVVFEPNATLAKVRELTATASRGDAKVVAFPEAFVSAYHTSTTRGPTSSVFT